MENVYTVPLRNVEEYNKAKDKLLGLLKTMTVPKIPKSRMYNGKMIVQRDMIIGNIGRTVTFGFGRTRTKGYAQFAANAKYPEVLAALVEFGNRVVPLGWEYNAITLNHNVLAKKHIDSFNVGNSIIVGIGEYTGGELSIFTPDDTEHVSYSIKDTPVMFNGAVHPHETKPFEGERFTIIYYRQDKGNGSITGHTTVGI